MKSSWRTRKNYSVEVKGNSESFNDGDLSSVTSFLEITSRDFVGSYVPAKKTAIFM